MILRGMGLILMIGILWMWGGTSWGANSCVDCHRLAKTVKALPAWYQDQFIHWYGSVHGRKGVTCDKCHGGDPDRSDRKQAHQGMKPSGDPDSRVYYKNLPETCGACHKGVYREFIQSRHYQYLKADRLAPTCTTCHGFQMDIEGVVPLQIAGRCTICHNSRMGVKPEVAESAREALYGVERTNQFIQKTQVAIELAKEQGLNVKKAQALLTESRNRLKRTGERWHRFDLNGFKKELEEIHSHVDEAYAAAKRLLMKK